MRETSKRRLLFVSLLLGLGACASDARDAANAEGKPSPLRDTSEPPGWTCLDGERTSVADDELVPALGFAAGDVLAFALGRHESPLRWSDAPDLQLAPDTGTGALDVHVERVGDAVLFTPDSVFTGHGATCATWLEIPARISLRSDARGLDDFFDATLRIKQRDAAFVHASTTGSVLGGKLQAKLLSPGSQALELTKLTLGLVVSTAGVSGELSGSWVGAAQGGEPRRRETRSMASWGAADCGSAAFAVGRGDSTHGALAQQLLSRIANLGPLTLTWDDSSSTLAHTDFVPSFPGACVAYSEDAFRVRSQGVLSVRSDDGQLDGAYPTWVSIDSVDAFTPLGIELRFESYPEDERTPAELGFVQVPPESVERASASVQILLDEVDVVHPDSMITLWSQGQSGGERVRSGSFGR